jgi:anthranilate phosphoribosyltransferase
VPSTVHAFDEAGERRWTLDPAAYGIAVPLEAIVVRSVGEARDAFLSVLGGERSPRAEVVALNAALVLYTAGIEPAMDVALARARSILASGEALRVYERAKELATND